MNAEYDHRVPLDERALLRMTDRCVQCGLCAPACPTYALSREEAESPRGRIALIQGIACGALAADAHTLAHLDRCLECLACEDVCPSRVSFGTLMDGARALLERSRRRPRRERALRAVLLDGVARPAALRLAGRALRLYQRSGLRAPARRSGALRGLGLDAPEALLPELAPVRRWHGRIPAQGPRRGTVALFTGCIAAVLDRPTLEAAVRVLTRLGFEVHIPSDQVCCGALHQHEGAPRAAARLARRNLAAFADPEVPIVTLASGCGAHLARYGTVWADDEAAAFAARVHDIHAFLAETPWPEDLPVAPLTARVAVHVPCTLANVLHRADAPRRILSCIPGLEVVALGGGTHCCGAAGAYVLHHPEEARRLREPKLAAVRALRADYLATANIGCALHLAAGLRGEPGAAEVVHPVVLLDRQLRAGAPGR